MRSETNIPAFNATILIVVLGVVITNSHAQSDTVSTAEPIAVSARPSPDSIVLRWAPLDLHTWQSANESGYRIERFTVARNGSVLAVPEQTILQHALRPLPESEWERLVPRDRYAAIAAQALFGDRFEVDVQQSDVFTIVNKVRENEQRFAFALFSADMSAAVARASGLWFSDYDIRINEKYLYRIILNASDKLRGSIFVSGDDAYELPKPRNLTAIFQAQAVSLKWEKASHIQYTGYLLERSGDGKIFKRVSDSPLSTVSPTVLKGTRFEYAIDSLPDPSHVYHYRVRGITPFGETGPPSDPVKGKGIPAVAQVPYISSAISNDNTSIDLRWDFPSINEDAIKGFDVERAPSPQDEFKSLTKVLLSPQRRTFTHINAAPSNYYRVVAHGHDGELYSSHVYFATLIDSIPPSTPTGLHAEVNDQGVATLRWHANPEADVYGYRVYKAFHLSEELAQLTSGPVDSTSISDHVDLNTLNERIYYRVMAVDRSQNHSSLSSIIEVSLPDKVKPQPPVMLPTKCDASGIVLSWLPGGSQDVAHYKVYRRTPSDEQWHQLHVLAASRDSLYSFKDLTAKVGMRNIYTIISVDDAQLESEPAAPVIGAIPANTLRAALHVRKPLINREEHAVTLLWDQPQGAVQAFRIFRAVDDEPMLVHKTIKGNQNQFVDIMIPGTRYRYRILAVFDNGQQSALSEELKVDY